MTSRDEQAGDDLAPVTPLFGVRGARPHRDGPPSADHPSQGARRHDTSASGAPGSGAPGSPSPDRDVDGEARRTVVDPPAGGDAVAETAAALSAISGHWSGDQGHGRQVTDDDDDGDDEPPEDLEAQRTRAENVSLHALSRRGVSSSEMASLLASRDLDPEVVADEVSRLEGVGLLNDRELAENLVRAKQERKGLGRGAVTSELRSRGIAPELIEQAMAEIDDDDEQARADEWARKRSSSLQGLDRATAERRLNGYLMRRGYRSETIRRAVEKALPRGGGSRGGVRFE